MTQNAATHQARFAASLLDPALDCPQGLRAWNSSDPTARLAVHRNNVVSSLIDALADTFPVVQELVGVEFFRAMAAVFVRQSPPRSRILVQYGGGLPDFLDSFDPARSGADLADMARLEFARVCAYHAADAETVANETIAMALSCDDRIGELHLRLHPSVTIIRSPHAVVSLWAAHQGTGDIGAIDPAVAENGLVLRDALDVLVLRLRPGAADFISALQRGAALGEAATAAAGTVPDFDLSATLTLLLGHGALTSIHLPQRRSS